MTKPIPRIQKYMTTCPVTIGPEQTLAHAHGILSEHHIRHLPVLKGGRLIGVVTARDLALVETLKDVDATRLSVEEAMSSEVYAVSPDAPLDQVVDEMARHKYGCAVVMQNQKVVGIFTSVDVCSAFGDLLRGRLSN